ncbi:hypothetical protein BaRGS_00001191 [Batillaria attramentaria]|uniref:Uncharacterized protein n=1 Tax=Batillaria attramentaria TaxID=370345 RepID=A0ABD0M7E5_9CAEN
MAAASFYTLLVLANPARRYTGQHLVMMPKTSVVVRGFERRKQQSLNHEMVGRKEDSVNVYQKKPFNLKIAEMLPLSDSFIVHKKVDSLKNCDEFATPVYTVPFSQVVDSQKVITLPTSSRHQAHHSNFKDSRSSASFAANGVHSDFYLSNPHSISWTEATVLASVTTNRLPIFSRGNLRARKVDAVGYWIQI